MPPPYIFYRIFDTNGVNNVRHPYPAVDDQQTGYIEKRDVMPPLNVQNVKSSIAQHEGLKASYEATGAELWTSSSVRLFNGKALPVGAGSNYMAPLLLKFPIKLMNLNEVEEDRTIQDGSRFAGKWTYSVAGASPTFRYQRSAEFTLKMTPGGITASGPEKWSTTYTGAKAPIPSKWSMTLSDFTIKGNSISFNRRNRPFPNGWNWQVTGSLSADGQLLTLKGTPIGSTAGLTEPMVFQRSG